MLPDMVQPTGLALCIPLPHPGVHRAPEGRPLTTLRPTTLPALQRLRNWKDVEDELKEIRQEEEAQKAAGFVSVWKLFVTRSMRWQLTSIIIIMAGQQLSGVNAVRGSEPASQHWPSAGVPAHSPSNPGLCLPDLLLCKPDLWEHGRAARPYPVCDGGHRRHQRGGHLDLRECLAFIEASCGQAGEDLAEGGVGSTLLHTLGPTPSISSSSLDSP